MRQTHRKPSPNCTTVGPHNPHWLPDGMLGDRTVEELCIGDRPPVAQVIYPNRTYHEVVEIEYMDMPSTLTGKPKDQLVIITSATGARDLVPLSRITIFP